MFQKIKSVDDEREYNRNVFGSIPGSVLVLVHFGVFERSQQLLADSAQASTRSFRLLGGTQLVLRLAGRAR